MLDEVPEGAKLSMSAILYSDNDGDGDDVDSLTCMRRALVLCSPQVREHVRFDRDYTQGTILLW